MLNFTFVVKTKDRSFLAISAVPRGAGDPDVSMEFGPARQAPGISTTELLVNVAIGLGSGVPAGIAANWLFVKLGLGRDTRLYDQTGELLASVKEIEAKLEALRNQAPAKQAGADPATPPE